MSSNGPFGRYRDRVNRDADDITGFFSTRAGMATSAGRPLAIVAGAVWAVASGWFG